MGKRNQHVVPHKKGWAVKREGSTRATKVTSIKKDAEKVARKIARNQRSELLIHGRDGKIQDKDSFGNDPCPPKDKKH